MFNRISSKILWTVFIVLLIVSGASLLFNNTNNASSFKADLVDIDTSEITLIQVNTPSQGEIQLKKDGTHWKVNVNDTWVDADQEQINRIVDQLIKLKAIRVATKDESCWAEFYVNDSLATKLQVVQGKKKTADLYLGKLSFKQPKNASPYMRQQPQAFTYVRLGGENETYSTEGMIGMGLNRPVEGFRKQILVDLKKEDINSLSFKSPDNEYSVTKQGQSWMLDGQVADSAAMVDYLSKISKLRASGFVDFDVPKEQLPDYTLTIQSNSGKIVAIDAFVADTATGNVLRSSESMGNWYKGSSGNLFDKVFPPKDNFLLKQEEE